MFIVSTCVSVSTLCASTPSSQSSHVILRPFGTRLHPQFHSVRLCICLCRKTLVGLLVPNYIWERSELEIRKRREHVEQAKKKLCVQDSWATGAVTKCARVLQVIAPCRAAQRNRGVQTAAGMPQRRTRTGIWQREGWEGQCEGRRKKRVSPDEGTVHS